MKRFICIIILFMSLINCELTTRAVAQTDSLSYAFGVFYGNMLKDNGLESISPEDFMLGLRDVYSGATIQFTKEQAATLINQYLKKQYEERCAKTLAVGREFLAKNAERNGVITVDSGIQYEVLRLGNGIKPKASDKVRVHYRGTHINGEVFDSSYDRGESVSFPLNRVIKGWTIGLQLMGIGAKYVFYLPSELAYGTNPPQGSSIEPNEVLIFEVELLGIDTNN